MSRKRSLIRVISTVCFICVAGFVTVALCLDEPHDWVSPQYVTCTSCHIMHSATGMSLTTVAGNANLCLSCHKSGGSGSALRLVDAWKADPGTGGTSHAWGVPVVNATYGSTTPGNSAMSSRLEDGNIMCSTCHDQHDADGSGTYWGRTLRAAIPDESNSGTGDIVASGTYTGTVSTIYTVKITQAGDGEGAGAALFQWMKTGGSWSSNMGAGEDVSIENGVLVSFYEAASTFALNDQWTIRASIPFLRASMASDAMCKECHGAWASGDTGDQVYNRVSTASGDNVTTWTSGKSHSHPTGYALNANSKGYDFSTPQPVPGYERIESNELKLDSSSQVQCTSCHGVHYCDSDSSTKDGNK